MKPEISIILFLGMRARYSKSSDEFTVRVASKPDDIKELLEAGFDFVCQKDDLMYFRRRK